MTEYLELADAARRMGLSSEALKKRLIRGTVPGRKVDGRWMVLVPDACHDVTPDVTTRDDGHHDGRHDDGVIPSSQPSPRDELIERLHRENLELAGGVGWLMAELEQAWQEIRLLSAPTCNDFKSDDSAPAPTSHQPGPEQNGTNSGAECPPPRPWWKFWERT